MKTFSKITFLVLSALAVSSADVQAQCIPVSSLPATGIYPGSIPPGTKGVFYTQTMQYKAPLDTSVNVPPFGSVPAKIDSLIITGVLGMPDSFTYQCHNSRCAVNGGEIGCVVFSGIPKTAGSYHLRVTLRIYGHITGSIPVPRTINDTNDNYTLVVNDPTTGLFELVDRTKPAKVYPNPGHDRLFIDAKAFGNAQPVNVSIYDLQGKVVQQAAVDVFATPAVDIHTLPAGMYMVELSNGTVLQRSHFVVE